MHSSTINHHHDDGDDDRLSLLLCQIKIGLVSIWQWENIGKDRHTYTFRGNDVIEIIECKCYTIAMNSIYLRMCYNIANIGPEYGRHVYIDREREWMNCFCFSFINLPFRLSLLVAFHTLLTLVRDSLLSVFLKFDWSFPFNEFQLPHIPDQHFHSYLNNDNFKLQNCTCRFAKYALVFICQHLWSGIMSNTAFKVDAYDKGVLVCGCVSI